MKRRIGPNWAWIATDKGKHHERFCESVLELVRHSLVLVSIIACGVLLWTQSVPAGGKTGDTTGHVWDETLEEYNNPLPKWWMWLFYITVIFSLVYCVLYPTLGSYQGVLGWSSSGQYWQRKWPRPTSRPGRSTTST
jgi:hypothetical protein